MNKRDKEVTTLRNLVGKRFETLVQKAKREGFDTIDLAEQMIDASLYFAVKLLVNLGMNDDKIRLVIMDLCEKRMEENIQLLGAEQGKKKH